MIKIFKYFNRKQWLYVTTSILFIVIQVWLDLKLPGLYVQYYDACADRGSTMSDILTQGGYMLMCAFGSMAASIVVVTLPQELRHSLHRRLGMLFMIRQWIFLWKKLTDFPRPVLSTGQQMM